jgi:hypothetical protein
MMQKVRSQALPLRAIALPLLVGARFQGLLTPLTGVLFTFPSRYLFTIGLQVVFSLARWSSQIQAGLHVSRLTWERRKEITEHFTYGALTRYGRPFHASSVTFQTAHWTVSLGLRQRRPTTPVAVACHRFGLFPFRSPLLGESLLFSFPQGTEMFRFPWFASCSYGFTAGSDDLRRRGFPHSEIHGS